jgi:hypothetical protein
LWLETGNGLSQAEWWNDGTNGKTLFPKFFPIFQYSNIPFTLLLWFWDAELFR